MYEASREFVNRSLSLLEEVGDIVELNYPKNQLKRTVDLALKNKENRVILIKLAYTTDLIGRGEREELKGLSSTLKVNSFIVAERKGDVKLVEGVVYDYEGSKVISIETLVNSLEGELPVIYEDRDSFKVKVNGEKLRQRRELKGYSLGTMARLAKVSRKAIYEYERGNIRPTLEVAERLINELGEDIVASIDIFNPSEEVLSGSKPSRGTNFDDQIEVEIARRLGGLMLDVCHARRAPLDMCLSGSNLKALIAVSHGGEKPKDFNDKVANMLRMARSIKGDGFVVVEPSLKDLAKELSEPEKVFTVEEFIDFIGGRVAEKADSNNWKARNRKDDAGSGYSE